MSPWKAGDIQNRPLLSYRFLVFVEVGVAALLDDQEATDSDHGRCDHQGVGRDAARKIKLECMFLL